MGRTLGWLALLGAVCSCAGCKMGTAPDDYTGPTYQNGYEPGGFYARRGSILGPGAPAQPTAQAGMPDPQPTVAPLPENPSPNGPSNP